jgi:O-antigen ligase
MSLAPLRLRQAAGTAWAPTAQDAVPALTLYALLQVLLPSRYVIGPLGAAGVPASLVALGIGLLWLVGWAAQPWPRSEVRQPITRPALALLAAVLASYLVAAMRPTSEQEQLSADRFLLELLGWLGVMMAATDGIGDRRRLDAFLRRLTWMGAAAASVGILQFLTGQTLIEYLHLPGLSDNGVDESLLTRGGFLRPAGTAVHPIEFGVSMAMLLPVALHLAVASGERRGRVARWLPVTLIALALPISISRSAVVCTTVALAVFLPAWPRRLRRRVYLAGLVLIAGLLVALPGFLNAIASLFTGISRDDSALSRTDSYAVAGAFISRAPLLGRGPATWLPPYRILDNQFLGSLIEIGVVGTTCLLALMIIGVVTSWQLRRPLPGPANPAVDSRDALGPAIAAAVAAGSVSFAFFDAFGFPMAPSLLFLLLGCAGALRRINGEESGSGIGDEPTG